MIRAADALSTRGDTEGAVAEVLDGLAAGLDGATGDLAVVFATMPHAAGLKPLARAIRDRGLGRVVIGCTAESVAAGGREVEAAPAIAAFAASLPGVDLAPFAIEDASEGWPEAAGAGRPEAVVLLGDPFSFAADAWFARAEAARPGVRVVGGMASGGSAPATNRLVLDDEVRRGGAVGVALRGPVAIATVVSQGCRPIGRSMVVTRADDNLLRELGRRPAMEALREVFEGLSEEDRRLGDGLHLGLVINEYQDVFDRGDFLIRNVIGADASGAIGVGATLRVGQTVRFHVRDASTADDDLRAMLATASADGPIAGALLFTCNGRGTRLFGGPDHDARAVQAAFGPGPVPMAGFFAMGELGPVGGRNFVHGFTASVVLIRGRGSD